MICLRYLIVCVVYAVCFVFEFAVLGADCL